MGRSTLEGLGILVILFSLFRYIVHSTAIEANFFDTEAYFIYEIL